MSWYVSVASNDHGVFCKSSFLDGLVWEVLMGCPCPFMVFSLPHQKMSNELPPILAVCSYQIIECMEIAYIEWLVLVGGG